MRYSLDTSGLLDGWLRYYSPDVFPGFWRRLEDLIAAGEVRAIDEVLRELERKEGDAVHRWARAQGGLFVAIDGPGIQEAVTEVLRLHPKLMKAGGTRSSCDPWVIALAMTNSGCAVVTGERASGSLEKPRIPDVCAALGVDCISLLGLMRREGWTFPSA